MTDDSRTDSISPRDPSGTANSAPPQDPGEHTRWNFAVIVTEAAAFMTGLAWADPVVVLPLFIHALTPSTVLVGLVTTLQRLGYALPILPVAAILGHRPRRLPFLRWGVFFGRLPFILFVIYLWTRGVGNATLVIAFMMIAFASVSAGNGFVAVPWQDIIAKSIPTQLRGRFFATMQFSSAVAAFGVGFAVRWALGPTGPAFPVNYTLLFTLAAVFFTISTIGCAIVREPVRPVMERPESLRGIIASALPLLRQRPEFRSLVLISVLAFGLSLTMPFYVVYAKTQLHVADHMAGIYIWAAVLAGAPLSLLWGRINDRRGPRAVLRGACALVIAPPLLAVLVPAAAHRRLHLGVPLDGLQQLPLRAGDPRGTPPLHRAPQHPRRPTRPLPSRHRLGAHVPALPHRVPAARRPRPDRGAREPADAPAVHPAAERHRPPIT